MAALKLVRNSSFYDEVNVSDAAIWSSGTKSGKVRLKIEKHSCGDDPGQSLNLDIDRIYAQLLARRLLQLAGNDKDFADPSLGEYIAAQSITEERVQAESARGIKLVRAQRPVYLNSRSRK